MSRPTKSAGIKSRRTMGKSGVIPSNIQRLSCIPLSVFSTACYEITEKIGYESRETLVREKKVRQFNIWSSLTVHNLLLVQCSPWHIKTENTYCDVFIGQGSLEMLLKRCAPSSQKMLTNIHITKMSDRLHNPYTLLTMDWRGRDSRTNA